MQMRESLESPDDPRFYPREASALTSEEGATVAAELAATKSEQESAKQDKLADQKRRAAGRWRNVDWWYGMDGGGQTFQG